MIDKDICKYWESIAAELDAAKSRVRNLIGSAHWLTDGTHKEILLRSVLRRHLPEELSVCTGFVYKNAEISSQIDILVISKSGLACLSMSKMLTKKSKNRFSRK